MGSWSSKSRICLAGIRAGLKLPAVRKKINSITISQLRNTSRQILDDLRSLIVRSRPPKGGPDRLRVGLVLTIAEKFEAMLRLANAHMSTHSATVRFYPNLERTRLETPLPHGAECSPGDRCKYSRAPLSPVRTTQLAPAVRPRAEKASGPAHRIQTRWGYVLKFVNSANDVRWAANRVR